MLILFDIDGTLLLSGGAGARAMIEAGRRLLSPGFSFDGVEISGRLDPLIWNDAARANGCDDPAGMHDVFRATYAEILAVHFATIAKARLLPGVETLVTRLKATDGVTLGLLTGNYPETGAMKVSSAGLDPADFPVAAWGSDGATRRDLPPVAIDRFRVHAGRPIDPADVVISGDTPHDIDCARANGCRALAVGTGPSCGVEMLRPHAPDLLVEDLSDTEAVLAWMLEGSRCS